MDALTQSPDDLDRLLHAAEGHFTRGLSPAALALANIDWAVHLANAPHRRLRLLENWLDRALHIWNGSEQKTEADPRFADPGWRQFPFNLISQTFLMNADWWSEATSGVRGTEKSNQRMVNFMVRQWFDMMSPSNIPWLNPEVIAATWQSGGRNFVDGMANLLRDLRDANDPENGPGFVLGKDLATTPGKVVMRNALAELIQYSPVTAETRPQPILIVPAWIMKYYILDLSPGKSLIGHLVAQGYTVFCLSWRNPGPEQSGIAFDDYRRLGIMAALDVIGSIAGPAKIHACGYCLGGTLLSIAAAQMARDGDDRLATASLLAAQTDFTEAGELQLFITEGQVAFLEDVMWAEGSLSSGQMAGAFQLLRSNDLIWSRAIRSYLLGKQDQPNDLMAWNRDATRMPYRMHAEYLRRMFLDNDLAEGRFPVDGRPVSIDDLDRPLFVVGAETDHVSPWRSVHKIHLLNKGEVTFVLTSRGHNAGIVSPPGADRHYAISCRQKGARYVGPEEWPGSADHRKGSWWTAWADWLDRHSGALSSPPPMGSSAYPPLCDAPGTYVLRH